MSSMSTTCPNCALHLAVTAADLRVGQGYVRCGRCEKVFNALISLIEDPRVPPETGHIATGTASVPALAQTPPPEAPEPAGSGTAESTGAEIVAAAFDPALPAPRPVATAQDDVEVIETLATGTFETIVLEGDGVLQTEEMVDAAEVDERLQEIAEQIAGTRQPDEPEAHDPAPDIAGDPAPMQEPEPDLSADLLPARTRAHPGWIIGAAALALLLALQLVHHHRQSLAEHGWARSLLAPVYRLFGATLEPRWDLAAYDVRQLGGEAVPGAAERILLRATVLNRATHAQPPPLLRVTLQDRFGNALAVHDVKPQDYLPATPPARLAPDQRIDAELLLDDPGSKAVGFEIDACLPTAAGPARCAALP
ncbi:MAG: zinc-ribbon and DUF3426 domain-containing protein [Steroidobacteraceae bacterium]